MPPLDHLDTAPPGEPQTSSRARCWTLRWSNPAPADTTRVTGSAESAHLEIAVSDGSLDAPRVRTRCADLTGDLDAINSSTVAGGITDDRDPRLDVGAAGSVVGGRGLQLVASLAAGWGVDTSGPGKSVWARLPTPTVWPPPPEACRCPGTIGGARLSSGRTVVHTWPRG